MLPKLGKVLVADPIGEEGQILLRMWTDVTINTDLTPERLEKVVGDYDALIVRSRTKVRARIIAAGRRLRAATLPIFPRRFLSLPRTQPSAASGRRCR